MLDSIIISTAAHKQKNATLKCGKYLALKRSKMNTRHQGPAYPMVVLLFLLIHPSWRLYYLPLPPSPLQVGFDNKLTPLTGQS